MKFFFSIGLTVLLMTAFCGAQDRIASEDFAYLRSEWPNGEEGFGWKGSWILSSQRPALLVDGKETHAREILIQGTGERNNPLRRELATSVRDPELFVRFNFRYDPEKDSKRDDSEFFVMWFDRVDGGDRAVHSAGIPNIGIHVADQGPKKGKVVFIVRIGSDRTNWSTVDLERGRNYNLVARLSKTDPDERAAFDRLELWVDPKSDDRDKPAASVVQKNGVNFVRWIGFATGRKTEATDRIFIDKLALSRSWKNVLDLSADSIEAAPLQTQLPPSLWTNTVDFKKDVYPLLKEKCFACHKGANSDSGYRLDVRSEVLGYSTGDPLAIPKDGANSKLFALTISDDPDKQMPPPEEAQHRLTPLESDLLRSWIDQGLDWDETLLPEPNSSSDHWSFQPVKRPAVPSTKREGWVRTPVDAFIADAQEALQLEPAEEASRRTLIRRLSLDLTGLPPTPDEIESFINDPSGNAYPELVERLLESSHYGERWGRFWLDLARWGESHGYQHDIPRPYAWRYRDYVIKSFNEDKPYDRFLKEQLAGDELEPRTDENLIATGFLAAARISGNQMDKKLQRNDVLVDIVNATGSAMLGLTLECAQCHNHKFDQLSQRDYYRMQAFFVNGQLGNLSLSDPGTPNPTNLEDWMSAGAYQFYMKEPDKLVKKKTFEHTSRPHTWGFHSPKTSAAGIERLPVVNRDPLPWYPDILKTAKARLLIRGEVTQPGPVVKSGWPEVLGKSDEDKSLTRTELADWMSDPENPLVSRVWVNRLWQFHFSRGIVSTPGDFGIQGEAPSHPELLDWLASELMENEWSTKHIHRLIVLSSTYRQKRSFNKANAAIDPDNTYLWNWPQRRLEAEAIRDSVLVATGELNPEVGGAGVNPEREEDNLRRTVYLTQRRSEMPRVMTMFDGPEVISSCSHREVSTVALQPLYLLNSSFMNHRASALAKKVMTLAGDDFEKQIETAFERTLGRLPDAEEKTRTLEMLRESSDPEAAFVRFCHALLNLNEFVYLN